MSASSERARRVLRRSWRAAVRPRGQVVIGPPDATTFSQWKAANGWKPRVQRGWDPERGKLPPHLMAQGIARS